jgi:hypothetical protein
MSCVTLQAQSLEELLKKKENQLDKKEAYYQEVGDIRSQLMYTIHELETRYGLGTANYNLGKIVNTVDEIGQNPVNTWFVGKFSVAEIENNVLKVKSGAINTGFGFLNKLANTAKTGGAEIDLIFPRSAIGQVGKLRGKLAQSTKKDPIFVARNDEHGIVMLSSYIGVSRRSPKYEWYPADIIRFVKNGKTEFFLRDLKSVESNESEIVATFSDGHVKLKSDHRTLKYISDQLNYMQGGEVPFAMVDISDAKTEHYINQDMSVRLYDQDDVKAPGVDEVKEAHDARMEEHKKRMRELYERAGVKTQ